MNLKNLRTSRGLSQEKLAALLNTNRTTISKIESSNKIPTVELLLSYSKEFKMPTDALLGRMNKYDGYIRREAYYKSKSYQEIVTEIFDKYIEILEQNERLEDNFFRNEREELGCTEIVKSLNNLKILEEIKKRADQVGVIFNSEEENILISILNLLVVNRNYEDITNLFLFLNNLDKFRDITMEIVKQDDSRIKLLNQILKEFNK